MVTFNLYVSTAALEDSQTSLAACVPALSNRIIQDLSESCFSYLKSALEVPRLYRRTNKVSTTHWKEFWGGEIYSRKATEGGSGWARPRERFPGIAWGRPNWPHPKNLCLWEGDPTGGWLWSAALGIGLRRYRLVWIPLALRKDSCFKRKHFHKISLTPILFWSLYLIFEKNWIYLCSLHIVLASTCFLLFFNLIKSCIKNMEGIYEMEKHARTLVFKVEFSCCHTLENGNLGTSFWPVV